MNKKVFFLGLLIVGLPFLGKANADEAQSHQEQAYQVMVDEEDGLPEIPELTDIFICLENEELLQQLQAVEEQRKALTTFETLQLAAAYLKACSWSDIRELIRDHLHENRYRYLTGASVVTLFVVAVKLSKRLQEQQASKNQK